MGHLTRITNHLVYSSGGDNVDSAGDCPAATNPLFIGQSDGSLACDLTSACYYPNNNNNITFICMAAHINIQAESEAQAVVWWGG